MQYDKRRIVAAQDAEERTALPTIPTIPHSF
jgi:hypothetical protein